MPDWIYLDNNATTKPLDAVVEAMQRVQREAYANPSSVHPFGQAVRHQVECARAQVAELIGAEPGEIVFTAGGTESINLAIRGAVALRSGKRHIVTSSVEHSAVRRVIQQLVREGYTVDELGVDGEGRIDLDELAARLTDETALVSLLWANNETGVLFDVSRAAEITNARGVPLHLDAVQAVGKVSVNVRQVPAQLLSLAAHKFHGPKGAGALYIQRRMRVQPLIVGGRQERDLRGGTEDVAAIVGMGIAAEALGDRSPGEVEGVARLRDRLERGITQAIPISRVNGAGAPRIGNTTNIAFRGLAAEALLILLGERKVCASSGAACSSGSLEPSHVLQAMGVPAEYAHGALRFSLSRFTTEGEVDRVAAMMPEVVGRLSGMGK